MKSFENITALQNYLEKYKLNLAITSFLNNMSKLNVESYKVFKNDKTSDKFVNHSSKRLCVEIKYKEETLGKVNTASLFIE